MRRLLILYIKGSLKTISPILFKYSLIFCFVARLFEAASVQIFLFLSIAVMEILYLLQSSLINLPQTLGAKVKYLPRGFLSSSKDLTSLIAFFFKGELLPISSINFIISLLEEI